ncbi:hypothetical protein PCAR4_140129 [Paraburkholderia caribensis]|nr:hypothetical protein PCAR4_140129 [Paraburkholderia caribensis]
MYWRAVATRKITVAANNNPSHRIHNCALVRWVLSDPIASRYRLIEATHAAKTCKAGYAIRA